MIYVHPNGHVLSYYDYVIYVNFMKCMFKLQVIDANIAMSFLSNFDQIYV